MQLQAERVPRRVGLVPRRVGLVQQRAGREREPGWVSRLPVEAQVAVVVVGTVLKLS